MIWSGPTTPAALCPTCSGPLLYNLVYRHAAGCTLRDQLDATQANDADRENRGRRLRPATTAELALCAALGATLVPPVTAHIVSAPPVWLRRFTDNTTAFDPDMEDLNHD